MRHGAAFTDALEATCNAIEDHESGVVVACSGGPDSSVLAFAAAASGVPVRLAYVNHHLEADCHRWEARVRALGAHLGLSVFVAHVPAARLRADPRGTEAAARQARYEALAELSAGRPVLTGHTASDRLETLFIRLLQGAGLPAINGPRDTADLYGASVVRPMLHWTRAQVTAALAEWGWQATRDPSNFEPAYLRAQVRPLATAVGALAPASVWRRSLDQVAADGALLEAVVADAAAHVSVRRREGTWLLRRSLLMALSPAMRQAVLHHALSALAVRPDAALVDRVCALVLHDGVTRAPGVRVASWGDIIRLEAGADTRAALPPLEFPTHTLKVGRVGAALGALEVAPWLGDASALKAYDRNAAVIDLDQTRGPLVLRRGAEDEVMHAVGKAGPRSLAALAKQAGWGAAARGHLVVIADADGPLWLVGVRQAVRAIATDRTTRGWVLRWGS